MSPACNPVCPGIRSTLLCILLFSGFCSCLYRYQLIDEPKTWHEARQYCKEKYRDLATVTNMEDMERLIAAAGPGYEGKVWIGLYDIPSSWRWSLSDESFYGEGEKNFKSWYKSEPNVVGRRMLLCAAINNSGWFDGGCGKSRPFVCYNRTQPDLSPTSEKRYFFISNEMKWKPARDYCKQHHTELASVRNETENAMIKGKLPNNQLVWIGLHRWAWRWWSDGQHHNQFDNWADGHPFNVSDSCAASVINATLHGKWVEHNCNTKLHFMCQNNKSQLFTVKLTALKSTIDLNNPAVTDDILNLMKERMKEKGITDAKISWIKTDKKIFLEEQVDAQVVKMDPEDQTFVTEDQT